MRFLKVTAVSLCLMVIAVAASCSNGTSTNAPIQSIVSKGDISVTVNATGKTGYAQEAKLGFGSVGKIEELRVEKGTAVAKDSVIAKLDTVNLELALSQAKVAQSAAKIALSQANITAMQSQAAILQAQIEVNRAESAQTQTESALTAAQFNLDRTQAVSDIKDDITNAEWNVRLTQMQMGQANSGALSYWIDQINNYQADLARYQNKLAELLAKDINVDIATYEIGGQKYDRLIVEDVKIKQQQISIAQKAVEQAKQGIQQAQNNVAVAKQNADLAGQGVEQAKMVLDQSAKAVEAAQKQLDSAIIVAPFNGVVADLNIKQNDYVIAAGLSAGTPIDLVNPASLEINTEVDEIDIAGIQVGQNVNIKMDAVPGVKSQGIVTSISMLPIVKLTNSGVVVYEVKVGFVGTPPAWAKSGMSANLDIITLEKKGVVLVPNKAVKQNTEGQKVVDVWVNNKSQQTPVKTGISDGLNTEILNGVNEGELVLTNP